MPRAIYAGEVIAESDSFEEVEGNVYFPPTALDRSKVRESTHTSVCPWKGTASYYDVVVGDDVNANAAWYYPQAKSAAKNIEGYIAFWKGVTVER